MLPVVPSWLAALVFLAILITANLVRVSAFGEFEFWFALIKVVAIIAFIVLGLITWFGWNPWIASPGMINLVGHGGFFPNGGGAIIVASLAVFFSYFGTEVVTVTAGEAVDPVRTVRRGMNSVVWRILLFYIGSIFIVVTLLPWNSAAVTESPYTAVLHHLNIPAAAIIMNLVVLTAVLSCLNSGLYASSRMLYSMAGRGEAPSIFSRVNKQGTPIWAVFGASSIGLLTVVANYFLPTNIVFKFLLASSGSVAVVVYLSIAATQLRGRRRLERETPSALTLKMWAFPYLTIIVIVALFAVIGGMAFDPESRASMLLTLLVTLIAVGAGLLRQRQIRSIKPASGHAQELS